jgi:hypothetical protein
MIQQHLAIALDYSDIIILRVLAAYIKIKKSLYGYRLPPPPHLLPAPSYIPLPPQKPRQFYTVQASASVPHDSTVPPSTFYSPDFYSPNFRSPNSYSLNLTFYDVAPASIAPTSIVPDFIAPTSFYSCHWPSSTQSATRPVFFSWRIISNSTSN